MTRRAMKQGIYIFGSAFFVLGLFFFLEQAHALTVTPLRQTAIVDPGESAVVSLFVINEETSRVEVVPEIDAFRIHDETGDIIHGTPDVAKTWIRAVEPRIVLDPGQSGQFNFSVNVPADAAPGSHYLVLYASARAGQGQVGVGSRVGMLFFLHVGGEVIEDVKVRDVSSPQWYTGRPFTVHLDIENTGNIQVIPDGTITLRDWRDTAVATASINEQSDVVLSGMGFRRSYEFSPAFWRIGPYTAHVQLKYGTGGAVENAEVKFMYIPIWAFGACGLILLFIGIRVIRLRSRTQSS
jgi:hypothetical protein